MSSLPDILDKQEPLAEADVRALRMWLDELEGDAEFFGATAEDAQRIGRIRARLQKEGALQ